MISKKPESNPTDITPKINPSDQEKPDNELLNESTKEESKILGKKTKRDGKKVNNDYCSACQKTGGNLLLCEECTRAYHMECLKLTEKDIPEGEWLCPICDLKKEKREKKEKKEKKESKPSNAKTPKETNQRPRRTTRATNKINKENKLNNIKQAKEKENKETKTTKDNNNKVNKKVNHKNNNNNKNAKKKAGKPKKNIDKNIKNIKNNTNNTNNNNNNEKINDENKDSNLNEEENYIEYNLINKTDLLVFLKTLSQYDIKNTNINELNINEQISNILKNSNSIKSINTMINNNRELSKYKSYWNLLLEKKSSTSNTGKRTIHYPIKCKDLYKCPEHHGLEEKYLNKTKGLIYPYVNGKTFTRLVNIYDFLLTFSSYIYLNKFELDEFYSALSVSEKYKISEIKLLSSIHISLAYLFIEEISEIPLQELFNEKEIELLIIKLIIETKKDDIKKIYSFIYYTWPELIRLFLVSKWFNREYTASINIGPILDKLYNVHDILEYNTFFNFEEKLSILEKLVIISYETNFVRYYIKEVQDKKNKYKKEEKDLEEDLRDIESKKSEFERHSKFTQPQLRIDEINKKLEEFQQNKNDKMKIKLENEKVELEKMVNAINDNNLKREQLINKIEELRDEIFDIPTVGRTYIGMDGRGYKYYHFIWVPNVLFIKVRKGPNENNEKYEWRIINNEVILANELIDRLSEKGIEELKLRKKLTLVEKKMKKTNNSNNKDKDKENKIIEDEENKMKIEKENNNSDNLKEVSVDDIFKNKVLKYENKKNPIGNDKQIKINFITEKTNQYESISERMKKIGINISKFLSQDNRQWESPINRSKLKAWVSTVNTVNNFVNLLLFFNERTKIPYKSEILSLADSLFGKAATRKIIEEDKNDDKDDNNPSSNKCPLIVNGNLDPYYINRELQYANRIKLWTKEYETYNVEKGYLEYLRNVKNIPQLLICLSIFEIIVIELNKRKDYNKKKGDNTFIPELIKNDENKVNFENTKNGNEFTKIEIKKPKVKKKKLIEWNVKCMFCHEFGELLCCENCPNVTHLACAKLTKIPDVWKCSSCVINRKII